MTIYKRINYSLLIILLSLVTSFSYGKNAPISFADLAERLMPSVVNISSTQTIKTTANPFSQFQFPPGSPFEDMFKDFNRPTERKATALGSGFIIDKKGIVVTNNHVIQGADDIIVSVNGSAEYKATVIGKDPYMDLAVLQIESNEKFIPVSFGDSDKSRIGDWVMAIGNPFGFGGTVTSGIISSKNRDIGGRYDDFIQTDASINQGNSGGPLFDLEGNVIGINTAIISPGSSGSIGIGFAIPSNPASKVIDQLMKYGETKRGWLGVRIQEVTKEIADVEKLKKPEGALVASVAENSPADKSGIKAGDIILEFDGKQVDTMRTLPKLVAQTEVGKKVEVKIWRNQKLITKKVLLGRLESSKEFKAENKAEPDTSEYVSVKDLKILIRDLTKEDISERKLPKNTKGVVVMEILDESPLVFLSVNDIIVEVQKNKIVSSSQFLNLVKDIINEGQETLYLAIYNSSNQRSYITVKLK